MADQVINTAVESARSCLWNTFKRKPAFLATHFSCGTPGMPGYIIESAAMATNCQFADWAKNDKGLREESLHGDVIIRHARQFQRSVTIPALLAKLSDLNSKPVILTLKVHLEKEPLRVKRTLKDDGCVWFLIQLGQVFASALCPRGLPEYYLRRLYDDAKQNLRSESLTEGELRPFDLPRYEAFGVLIANSTGLEENVNALIPGDVETKAKAWTLLGTLQSALLYFEGGRAKGRDGAVTGFAGAFPLRGQTGSSDTPFGFVFGAPLRNVDPNKVRDCFSRELLTSEVQAHINGEDSEERLYALVEAVSKVTRMGLDDTNTLSTLLKTEIAAIVPFAGQQMRLRLLGFWMIYLISELKGAKHEGKSVDFWFVAGERTEFADDVDVRLEKHPLRVK